MKPPKERIIIECLDYTKFTDENVYNVFRDLGWDHIFIETDAKDMLEQFYRAIAQSLRATYGEEH